MANNNNNSKNGAYFYYDFVIFIKESETGSQRPLNLGNHHRAPIGPQTNNFVH